MYSDNGDIDDGDLNNEKDKPNDEGALDDVASNDSNTRAGDEVDT